jgi:hypothetical protein
MPIFMDRHDMRDVTAENVSEAHRRGTSKSRTNSGSNT